MTVKTKGSMLYCEKHNGWFFSSKYAKTGSYPDQCNICKQHKYWEEKRK